MGQKVNPHGLRVGINKDWDSKWYASDAEFADNLVEDYNIRKFLKKKLYKAGISKIVIERTTDRVRVIISTAMPGMVIGKAGRKRHMGFRPTVRGSAMNPNDHPHGGGEGKCGIGRPGPSTPWGKPALGLRTRKKNKHSNKYIIRRRDGKSVN